MSVEARGVRATAFERRQFSAAVSSNSHISRADAGDLNCVTIDVLLRRLSGSSALSQLTRVVSAIICWFPICSDSD